MVGFFPVAGCGVVSRTGARSAGVVPEVFGEGVFPALLGWVWAEGVGDGWAWCGAGAERSPPCPDCTVSGARPTGEGLT